MRALHGRLALSRSPPELHVRIAAIESKWLQLRSPDCKHLGWERFFVRRPPLEPSAAEMTPDDCFGAVGESVPQATNHTLAVLAPALPAAAAHTHAMHQAHCTAAVAGGAGHGTSSGSQVQQRRQLHRPAGMPATRLRHSHACAPERERGRPLHGPFAPPAAARIGKCGAGVPVGALCNLGRVSSPAGRHALCRSVVRQFPPPAAARAARSADCTVCSVSAPSRILRPLSILPFLHFIRSSPRPFTSSAQCCRFAGGS